MHMGVGWGDCHPLIFFILQRLLAQRGTTGGWRSLRWWGPPGSSFELLMRATRSSSPLYATFTNSHIWWPHTCWLDQNFVWILGWPWHCSGHPESKQWRSMEGLYLQGCGNVHRARRRLDIVVYFYGNPPTIQTGLPGNYYFIKIVSKNWSCWLHEICFHV